MIPTVHDLRHQGVDVRLVVGPETMHAVARVGRFAKPVSSGVRSHHGLVDMHASKPQEATFAKALVQEVVDRALQRNRRSAFDKLVDELHEARQRAARRPMRKALVFRQRGSLAGGRRLLGVPISDRGAA